MTENTNNELEVKLSTAELIKQGGELFELAIDVLSRNKLFTECAVQYVLGGAAKRESGASVLEFAINAGNFCRVQIDRNALSDGIVIATGQEGAEVCSKLVLIRQYYPQDVDGKRGEVFMAEVDYIDNTGGKNIMLLNSNKAVTKVREFLENEPGLSSPQNL